MYEMLRVSVIICTYSTERLPDFMEALESIKKQTYPLIEAVIVVDGNKELYDTLLRLPSVSPISSDENYVKGYPVIHLNEKNLGLSKSRNIGAEIATGDVVAFIDDDAVADPNWIAGLVDMYAHNYNAVAAGGMLKPLWVAGVADFIPEEFWWLVGANPKGSPEQITEVRNTYGSNISFARDIFLNLGGFNSSFGFNAGKGGILQGEEAELCNKVKNLTGKGCMYNPNAVVYHKVFKERIELKPLFRRAFWQGYSKRVLEKQSAELLRDESGFLKYVLFTSVPERIIGMISMHPWRNIKQLFFLLAFTGTVGAGYMYRMLEVK